MSRLALEIQELSFAYGSRLILDGVSARLARGQITGLIGPNGSGKTTLLKAVSGLLPLPQSEAVRVKYLGQPLFEHTRAEQVRRVAYVGSDPGLEFGLTAQEWVLMGRSSWAGAATAWAGYNSEDHDRVHEAMERTDTWKFRDQRLRSLSGGERQRVGLARGLAQGARVLFLDEAFSRMDLDHQMNCGALLRRLTNDGLSVFWTEHELNLLAEWADEMVALKDGRVVASGSAGEVLSVETIEALYPKARWGVAPGPGTSKPQIFFKG